MGLDAHGIVSVVQIIVFAPIFGFSLFLTIRHGVRRHAGWLFLVFFSNIRVIGGIMLIVAESLKKPSIGIFITSYVLASAGLSPLLLATLSFLSMVGQHAQTRLPITAWHYRMLHVLLAVAVALAVVGGTNGSSSSISTQNNGNTLRRVASLIFVGVFVTVALITLMLWSNKNAILLHRRTLLVGLSSSLPFLAIRVLYSVLSAFSPSSFGPRSLEHTSLSKFNTVNGSWQIYITMSLLMEFIAVAIYCTTGTLLPLQAEERDYEGANSKNVDVQEMYRQTGGRVNGGR
ncbi:hypothetical protein BD410DRAFT_760623 [Rickenella mellea]|uniref:DUF7702 domain-containing protein n=1 Tax=Rickenella mellea TaxID=50990 RepID=A0A4Y7QND6_9AGAM|nr:hypothetical protein BD410DRAFT_760623 [Rickenella mellea]